LTVGPGVELQIPRESLLEYNENPQMFLEHYVGLETDSPANVSSGNCSGFIMQIKN